MIIIVTIIEVYSTVKTKVDQCGHLFYNDNNSVPVVMYSKRYYCYLARSEATIDV